MPTWPHQCITLLADSNIDSANSSSSSPSWRVVFSFPPVVNATARCAGSFARGNSSSVSHCLSSTDRIWQTAIIISLRLKRAWNTQSAMVCHNAIEVHCQQFEFSHEDLCKRLLRFSESNSRVVYVRNSFARDILHS